MNPDELFSIVVESSVEKDVDDFSISLRPQADPEDWPSEEEAARAFPVMAQTFGCVLADLVSLTSTARLNEGRVNPEDPDTSALSHKFTRLWSDTLRSWDCLCLELTVPLARRGAAERLMRRAVAHVLGDTKDWQESQPAELPRSAWIEAGMCPDCLKRCSTPANHSGCKGPSGPADAPGSRTAPPVQPASVEAAGAAPGPSPSTPGEEVARQVDPGADSAAAPAGGSLIAHEVAPFVPSLEDATNDTPGGYYPWLDAPVSDAIAAERRQFGLCWRCGAELGHRAGCPERTP